MITEHASERLITRYADGDDTIPGDQLWALEAHLESCAGCRAKLSAGPSPATAALVDGVWAQLESQLTPPPARRRPVQAWLATWAPPAIV
ncbi:MAG: hypothetical protein QOF58_4137, partial [Pseudonocardiales bacterium]|nr:hypothetical protein [Pseudonocardiales bacterium]